jgi:predicted lipoprotein with Yx(FWY)xxD motif
MTTRTWITRRVKESRRRRGPRILVISALALLVSAPPLAGASTPTSLRSINEKGYTSVLADHSSRALYVLSVEKGARIKCRSTCVSIWPPLLVASNVKSITLGAGVKGKIGFVRRSRTKKQVTFNSYPVYYFTGDTGPRQMNGQGIVGDGGTWSLVRASARNPSATPMLHSSGNTTTTSGGYSYGY